MIIAKSMEVRDNFKAWCGQAESGEIIQISRPGNNYIYLINQKMYEKLTADRRVTRYALCMYGNDKITNLKRLSEIEKLSDNWNNNGAEKFTEKLIKFTRKLIVSLEHQPEVFPTAGDAIQLEWENDNNEYLEMEILEDSINVFQVDSEGNERQNTLSSDCTIVNKIVGDFYDRAV